jgi:uncharacterized membrane protein YkvA (DUF1232 family)
MASPRMSIIRNLVSALRLASRPGGPSMAQRLSALPRLARAVARGEYTGATTGRLLLMVGALGWLLSPVDLMPEAVLGVFGLVDDAMIVSWLVTAVVTETEEFLGWEKGVTATAQTAPSGAPGASGGSAAAETVRGHVVR